MRQDTTTSGTTSGGQQGQWQHDRDKFVQTSLQKIDTSYEGQIAALIEKMQASTTADETKQYADIIANIRRQQTEDRELLRKALQEEEGLVYERSRQQKMDEDARQLTADTRRMQIAAASVSGLPGMGLLVAAVMTHDPSYAYIGGPLVAIGAASLSERVVSVVTTWFNNMWPNAGGKDKSGDKKDG